MEFGPRALGNRSILADPRNAEMQFRINRKVKKRESFRPFAPSILARKSSEYFNTKTASPYMLLVYQLDKKYWKEIPAENATVHEKLKAKKSDFPSITHADQSARVQTVSKDMNPRFHALLEEFYLQTGCPMLINTSFNERGEPMVQSAEDAFNAFMRTELDVLVLDNYVIDKKDVQHLRQEDFFHKFKLD
jgi:carbamoyltransferase